VTASVVGRECVFPLGGKLAFSATGMTKGIMMRTARTRQRLSGGAPRRAFTLIEMLVSVTLVLLMMTLFAGIFQAATSSMSKMKGFAENDQKARMLDTIVRSDLVNRSMSKVYPWTPGTLANDFGALPYETDEITERRGYFHISEGQPDDDTDDVLQLTTDVTLDRDVPRDQTPYGGRAVQLTNAGLGNANLVANLNQPVYDDSRANYDSSSPANRLRTDRATASSAAEVVYFLRGGVLYRRVLLLRNTELQDAQPKQGATATDMIAGTYTPANATSNVHVDDRNGYSLAGRPLVPSLGTGAGNYYHDFDMSAHFDPTAGQLRFHGLQSLSSIAADSLNGSLCDPRKRFGFYPEVTAANLASNPRVGMPISVDSAGRFFGRFTHRETSDPAFIYPGAISTNPYSLAAAGSLQLNRNATSIDTAGVMSGLGADTTLGTTDDVPLNGARAGEDILLTNVLGFDVKVLDEDLLPVGYVDLGHAGQVDPLGTGRRRGYYRHAMNLNPRFGPVTVFGLTTAQAQGADGEWGRAGVDDDNDGTPNNASERGWPGSDDPWNRCYDTWSRNAAEIPLFNPGNGTHLFGLAPFRAIDIDTAWFGADGRPGDAGVDDDGDGIVDNITELWWDDPTTTLFPNEDTAVNTDTDDRTPRQLAFGTANQGRYFSESSASRELGPDGTPGNSSSNSTADDDDIPDTGPNPTVNNPSNFPLYNTFYELTFPDTDDAQPWSQNRNVTVRPLLAIQIRIRYIDPTSNQIRELTLQQRLREQDDDDVGD
jgi:hypothetical protein